MKKIGLCLMIICGIIACSGCPSENPNKGIGTSPAAPPEADVEEPVEPVADAPWQALAEPERDIFENQLMCSIATIVGKGFYPSIFVPVGEKTNVVEGMPIWTSVVESTRECASKESSPCKDYGTVLGHTKDGKDILTALSVEITDLETLETTSIDLIDFFALQAFMDAPADDAAVIAAILKSTGEWFCYAPN
jgi:hypothetical protein